MTMKRYWLAMLIAGATGPFTAVAQTPGDAGHTFAPRQLQSSIGRIGDAPRSISDGESMLPRDNASPDLRPEIFRQNQVDASLASQKINDDWGTISDEGVQFTESPSDSFDMASGDSAIVGGSTGWCPPACGPSGCGSNFDRSGWWAETEALLWFGRQASTPTLAVTGPQGVFPTTPAFGGNASLGGDLAPGYRVNVGKWLDDCQNIGVGGRVFGIFDGESTETISSDGSVSLGVPFFDVINGQQTYLVAFDTGLAGRDTGSISVGQDFDFVAAEAYGRLKLAGNNCSRADLIGGYTYLRFDNATTLQTVSVDGISNLTVDGTVTTTLDAFEAENVFHGGHIGILSDINSGFCTVSTLGKISLGNMESSSRIFGRTTEDVPNIGVTTTNVGLLTGATNIGSQTVDRFTFIPELGAKLRMDLTQRLSASVGYTLIVLPDVALGSDLVTTTTDTTGFGGVPVNAGGPLRDQTFYLQGVDLGMSLRF